MEPIEVRPNRVLFVAGGAAALLMTVVSVILLADTGDPTVMDALGAYPDRDRDLSAERLGIAIIALVLGGGGAVFLLAMALRGKPVATFDERGIIDYRLNLEIPWSDVESVSVVKFPMLPHVVVELRYPETHWARVSPARRKLFTQTQVISGSKLVLNTLGTGVRAESLASYANQRMAQLPRSGNPHLPLS